MDRREILWRIRSLLGSQIDIIRADFDLYPRLNSATIQSADACSGGFSCSPLANADMNSDASFFPRTWMDRLLGKAGQIMRDHLSFFDLEDQYVGKPIEWHRDFSAGKTGPLRHCTLTDYRDFEVYGDCKLVWEPNRHHQLVVLARAYAVTGNTSYAKKVVDLMLDWIGSNPFGYGMNWKSPLETGIRLINWVWAIDLIRTSGVVDDHSWDVILQTVYRAVWDTQRKFSQGSSANNHLIGEAAGVFVACAYFPFLPRAKQWSERSKSILEHEILAQTHADGCTREHAFGYQFFVVQFLTLAKIAGDRSNNPLSEAYDARLHEMYRFLAEVSTDTGRPPNVGDADDGYVLDLGDMPKDAFELISVAAQLFDDPDLQFGDTSETAFWLFGKTLSGPQRSRSGPASKAFADSGYFLLRADCDDKRICVFFDCAALGYGSIAAHGHADCLSILLSVNGKEILVDAGTYDYFSYPDWRLYFRKTQAHNTLTVDDACQSVSSGPFMWSQHANAQQIDWQDNDKIARTCGEHDGYRRLPDPVIHKRTVTLDKTAGALDICDQINAAGRHRIKRYLHLAPECHIADIASNKIRIVRDNIEIVLTTDAEQTEIEVGGNDRKLGWISRGYHRRTLSRSLVMEDVANGNSEYNFHIDVIIGPEMVPRIN